MCQHPKGVLSEVTAGDRCPRRSRIGRKPRKFPLTDLDPIETGRLDAKLKPVTLHNCGKHTGVSCACVPVLRSNSEQSHIRAGAPSGGVIEVSCKLTSSRARLPPGGVIEN